MIESYNPKHIEKKAQAYWKQEETFKVETEKESLRKDNYYCLSMFPYTSGNIHMGHVRNYTIGDVKSRLKKMQGFNVLQPMGWDSFGLPAENAAIKDKSHPALWTNKNIESMKKEFQEMGFAYDWSRELATCDEDYYKWQQWLFIEMRKRGLVYKKDAIVNWDPVDQTVLANEQVIDGRGWRSNALVEQKNIAQWFCKITAYADELDKDLESLTKWPDAVKTMQKNWIGKSKGTNVHFEIKGRSETLSVFTTRADTLFGATFMAIAIDHPVAADLAKENKDIESFIKECQKQSTAEADIQTAEKKGIMTDLVAINPVNNEEVPIWIANYILMSYGTGAIMAVPAEDKRDREFAEKHDLKIVEVYSDEEKPVLINSGKYNGLEQKKALQAIVQDLVDSKNGESITTYRLRDWGISRQRYWGVPIPIVNCAECGAVSEKEENLPIRLPKDIQYEYGKPLLKECKEFYETTCPKCGKAAHRETDTFDTFFDSSWYYHYYISQGKDGITSKKNDQWMGVDLYIGGIEHAILHLLYARFIQKVLYDMELTEVKEPFTQLLSQGMVLKNGAKMSKSKGNVISPKTLIEKYGADTIRLFIIFAAPPTQDLDWSDGAVEGCYRFLKKVWTFVQENIEILQSSNEDAMIQEIDQTTKDHIIAINQTLVTINRDTENIHLNTVASGAMKLFQVISKIQCTENFGSVLKYAVSILLRVLNPIAPHMTHELWQEGKFGEDIAKAKWAVADESILNLDRQVTVVMQINGKKKGTVTAQTNASEDDIIQAIKGNEQTNAHMNKIKPIKKTIFVKNKLINFVV
ncbi:MAG: leucine--tRNA ligase [Pseudomonadota bacterium]|nr:leucine--tRNA ligase [Pseudomonadota bacterium]